MNQTIRNNIVTLLKEKGVAFTEYSHAPCASSEESARTREAAGAGKTVGAKAILVKTKKGAYSVLILPGNAKLDSKKVRKLIGKHSFATSEEMEIITGGLKPGHMPPFGPQLFNNITQLIIDPIVGTREKIGFNAGEPTISIVLSGKDYLKTCSDECVMHDIITTD